MPSLKDDLEFYRALVVEAVRAGNMNPAKYAAQVFQESKNLLSTAKVTK